MQVIAKVTVVTEAGSHPPRSLVEIPDKAEAERLVRIGHASFPPVQAQPVIEEPKKAAEVPRRRR